MEVRVNKEIKEYSESLFFGLNLRQCICSVLAVLAAVGIYFGTREVLIQEIAGWLCVLGAAPFAACGFFKYHGMTAEQFVWAVIKSEILYPRRLTFQSENIYYDCLAESIEAGARTGGDGTQVMKKKEKRAGKKKGRGDAVD